MLHWKRLAEGIPIIILASQAQRCRVLPQKGQPVANGTVGGSQIDPTRLIAVSPENPNRDYTTSFLRWPDLAGYGF